MVQSTEEISVSTTFKLPSYQADRLCHILLGDYAAVIAAINHMAVLGYCDRISWLNPVPTGRNGEYISVMNRRLPQPQPDD
ncbi:hypothetical protein C7271_12025 [filamentous cyanobacterium CCP5]|nr:hypothetical protein C7271_12025 [filamentous cyanobacterium CCP5]